MELHGMIMLRIADDKFGRIRLHVENEDKKGVQLQVCRDLMRAVRAFPAGAPPEPQTQEFIRVVQRVPL